MAYEKLSRRALGCMYTAEIIGDVIFIVLIGIVNIFWLIPKQIEIGRWISAVLLIYAAVSMLVEPYFRYNRYRYSINEECIDIREGYLFVKRNIVPIERLHKLEISKGPIDQIFHVAKVTVTTAGGDAAGMSTACEAMAARHMGMKVCGISCITNLAAGMSTQKLDHKEVQETADRVAEDFKRLVTESIRLIGETLA